jgi:hypothetical protein
MNQRGRACWRFCGHCDADLTLITESRIYAEGRQSVFVDLTGLFRGREFLRRHDNHNGTSEGSELIPANELLAAVGHGFGRHHREDAHGNRSRFRGFVHLRTESGRNRPASAEDGRARTRPLYDVCLVTR